MRDAFLFTSTRRARRAVHTSGLCRVAALLLFAACALPASGAAAQSFRLHLETGVLGIASTTVDNNGNETDDTTTRVGIFPTDIGLGAGFLIKPSFMLGLSTYLYGDDGGFRLKLLPYFEYLFAQSASLRPFIGATAGIDHYNPDRGDTYTSLIIGGLGGVHIMMASAFSIDVSGRLTYESWSEGNTDVSVLAMTVLLGLSGWM